MARHSGGRRVGLTGYIPFESLHPNAKDARAAAKLDFKDIDAPPESSSEDEQDRRAPLKSSHTPEKPLLEAPRRKHDSPGQDDDMLKPSKRIRQTFSRRTGANSSSSPKTKSLKEQDHAKTLYTKSRSLSQDGARKSAAGFEKPRDVETFRAPQPAFKVPIEIEKAKFHMPTDLTGTGARSDTSSHARKKLELEDFQSPDTQALSSQSLDIRSSNTTKATSDAGQDDEDVTTPTCPVCCTPVIKEDLDALSASLAAVPLTGFARYRRKTAFCRSHREAAGHAQWQKAGYPKIDWSTLPARFERHRAALLSILDGTKRSHFRDQLQEQFVSRRAEGKHMNRVTIAAEFAHESDGSEHVGYYGGRGARLMMVWLADRLGKSLRQASEKDSLVKDCGSISGYVQRVLVPELATLMVVDDMRAAADDVKEKGSSGTRLETLLLKKPPSMAEAIAARQRLEESAELGQLLCLEEDDEIDGDNNRDDNVASGSDEERTGVLTTDDEGDSHSAVTDHSA